MVGIAVRLGIVGVEPLGEGFVWVGLDGECLSGRQDLEEEGEVPAFLLERGAIREGRRPLGMSPDPQLGVRAVRIDLVYDAALQRVPRHPRIQSPYSPRVILHGRAEGQNRPAVAARIGRQRGHDRRSVRGGNFRPRGGGLGRSGAGVGVGVGIGVGEVRSGAVVVAGAVSVDSLAVVVLGCLGFVCFSSMRGADVRGCH
mmetsp:Transcript_39061/g.117395  ORF Transcript_39061/g.117395 Transcript_39061/m.117395 type:complete len:200 (-) Transcript_39061:97-696(-)